MTRDEVRIGDVVQIRPEGKGIFPGCFMTVTEVKTWGVQGYILIPVSRDKRPGVAYYRATWETIALIGHAEWLLGTKDGEGEGQ